VEGEATGGDFDNLTPAKSRSALAALVAMDCKWGTVPDPHEADLAYALAQMQSGNFLGFRQLRKTLPNETLGGARL
jgi:hypothetical protein